VVGDSYIDYSQPLIVSEPYPVEVPVQPAQEGVAAVAEPLPPGVTQPGLDGFNRARAAFYARDYTTALREIDQAAVEMPQDATVHEFRGLVLFALGRYQEAAAPVHAVLAVGPGWDWTTMVGLYPSVESYTAQFRTLEKYVREHPDDAPSHFLAAYHYITTSNTKAAISRLREVTQLLPNDTVSAELLRMLSVSEGEAQPPTSPPTSPPTPVPDATPLTTEQLKGDWIASGPNGSEYRVSFADDGSFRWTYASGKQKEEIGGVYAVDGDVLAMEPDSGGMLAARISKPSSKALVFEPAGAPSGSASLKFQQAES
jgi:tetratricopeptide (TPR) repeat protein